MTSSTGFRYPSDYGYAKVSAGFMFEYGGDGAWGNSVRGCLVCMYQQGVEPHPAHTYCYGRADAQLPWYSSARGYGTAVPVAGFFYYRELRKITTPIARYPSAWR